MLRLACLFCLLATLADAGPWPREKGRVFTANSIELSGFRLDRDLMQTPYFSSSYMEYGLSRSLTIGLHVGHGSSAELDARAFLRVPLSQTDPHRFAVELSAGMAGDTGYVGLGLQYGRGFTLFERNGWITIEGRVDMLSREHGMDYRQGKLDVTLGLTHRNGVKTMAQLFATETGGDIYASFAPGVAVPLWRRATLEAGVLLDVTRGNEPGLKLGLWQEF